MVRQEVGRQFSASQIHTSKLVSHRPKRLYENLLSSHYASGKLAANASAAKMPDIIAAPTP